MILISTLALTESVFDGAGTTIDGCVLIVDMYSISP